MTTPINMGAGVRKVAPSSNLYREPSAYESDGGNLIGRDPRQIPIEDLRALGHPTSPIKAIRAKCLDCSVYQPSEVRKCVAHGCPLWPFRMGRNPFYGHSGGEASSDEALENEPDSLDGFQTASGIAAIQVAS